jgi:hypothetical protein
LVSEFKAFGLLPLALLAIAKAASSLAFMSVPLQWVRAGVVAVEELGIIVID